MNRDNEVLSIMENTPLGYLVHKPLGNVNTEQGPQNIGSNLAHQVNVVFVRN